MTSITKQTNDDLEALIDLLADGDDETNLLPGPGLHSLSISHESSAAEQRDGKDSKVCLSRFSQIAGSRVIPAKVDVS